jgi:DNA-binding MarR family transcriptional regulator
MSNPLADSTAKTRPAAAVKTTTRPPPHRRAGGKAASAQAGERAASEQWEAELLELGRAFRRVLGNVRRMRGRDTHLLADEVSHAQMELLVELSEHGPMSAGELAQAAQLTPATVTQMLDHLAASGHVQRTRSDSDRRVVVSRLTPQGERRVAAKRRLWQQRWQGTLADVGVEELRVATRVLDRLSAVFEDAPEGGGCGAGK